MLLIERERERWVFSRVHKCMLLWVYLQIALQMDQATRPGISQVQVEWGPLTDKLDPPLQAPCRIPSLFSANRLVVYGFVKNCTQVCFERMNFFVNLHVGMWLNYYAIRCWFKVGFFFKPKYIVQISRGDNCEVV